MELSDLTSLAALAVAILAAIYSHRQTVHTERQANEARRANDLLEAEQERTRAREQAEAEANRVRWTVEATGSAYVLRNTGTDTAHRVQAECTGGVITSGPTITIDNGVHILAKPEVASGESLRFTLADPSPWTGDGHELLVTWQGQDVPVAVPLPPMSPSAERGKAGPRWMQDR